VAARCQIFAEELLDLGELAGNHHWVDLWVSVCHQSKMSAYRFPHHC
jgi:hypothetical protein